MVDTNTGRQATNHDPITLEIIQSSLQAAADEMFLAMRRTAMSSISAFVGVLDKARKTVIDTVNRDPNSTVETAERAAQVYGVDLSGSGAVAQAENGSEAP